MCTVVPVHDATRPKRVLFHVLACEKEKEREREGGERNERRRRKKKEVRGRQRIGKEEEGKGLPPLGPSTPIVEGAHAPEGGRIEEKNEKNVKKNSGRHRCSTEGTDYARIESFDRLFTSIRDQVYNHL